MGRHLPYGYRFVRRSDAQRAHLEPDEEQAALKRLKSQEDRLTDAYLNEAMDLKRYKSEMDKLAKRREELERITVEDGRVTIEAAIPTGHEDGSIAYQSSA